VPDLCINAAYYSARLSQPTAKKDSRRKCHVMASMLFYEKKTASEVKGNRENYALKMSLPLSYSSGGVTKGTI